MQVVIQLTFILFIVVIKQLSSYPLPLPPTSQATEVIIATVLIHCCVE